jgi:hypothetical protein
MKNSIWIVLLLATACSSEPFEKNNDLFGTGGASGEAGKAGASGEAGGMTDAGLDSNVAADAEICPVTTIEVKSAIYAASCGKATTLTTITTECDGLVKCEYMMSNAKDPGSDIAPGCWKDLSIVYNCGDETKSVYHDKTWDDLVVVLDCGCST